MVLFALDTDLGDDFFILVLDRHPTTGADAQADNHHHRVCCNHRTMGRRNHSWGVDGEMEEKEKEVIAMAKKRKGILKTYELYSGILVQKRKKPRIIRCVF